MQDDNGYERYDSHVRNVDRPHEEDYIVRIHDRCAYLRAPLVQQTGHLENKGPISRLSQRLMLGIAVKML